MESIILQKYARLLIKTGINIQKDQTLVITSPIECASFARLAAKAAYEDRERHRRPGVPPLRNTGTG